MAVRPQVPEPDRLPERDRLWALTQPAVYEPVLTRPMLEPTPAPSPVSERAAGATSLVLPGGEDGWVPAHEPDRLARGADVPAHEVDPSARDAADVAARRISALATAGKAYADAHGHPLTHPRAGDGPPRGAPLRWAVPVRLALTAALALGLVGGAVALRAASVASGGLVPIELPPVGVTLSAATAGIDGPAGAAPTGGAATQGSSADGSGPGVVSPVSGGAVVVHVVGEVASPGVVELPGGSRVDDAIRAAGGATARADLAALNLARVLIDGEQVVVPAPGADLGSQAGAQPAGRAAGAADAVGADGSEQGTVDLNGADAAALDALPGIGPVLAGRIVDWRQAHGRFTAVDEIGEVDGIGPTLLTKLRPLVRV
jgi:competence protein ComEA